MPIVATPISDPDLSGVVGRFGATPEKVRTWLAKAHADNLSNQNGTDQNNPTPDPAAYQQAITWADNWFERRLVGIGLVIPAVAASGSLAAWTAEEFTVRAAGVKLYEKKPLGEQTKNTFAKVMEDMENEMKGWRSDPDSLPPGFPIDAAGHHPNRSAAPLTLYPTKDRDGRPVTPSNERRGAYWDGNAWRYRYQ